MKKITTHFLNFVKYIILFQFIIGISSILPNISYANRIRGFLVRPFFKRCGKNFQLAKGAIINMPRNIEIGNNVYFAHNIWINGSGGLSIGDGVVISPNVVIATTKHQYIDNKVCLNSSTHKPISIGSGTWIASNSTISLGVKIGAGCIIGANSVVTKSIDDYMFVTGVPARAKKNLKD